MSWWVLPTTADIGLRICGPSPSAILSDAVQGLQTLGSSDEAIRATMEIPQREGEIHLKLPAPGWDRALLALLSEVIWRIDAKGEWITGFSLDPRLNESDDPSHIQGIARWIPLHHVERSLEIKAATHHALRMEEVADGERDSSLFDDLPPVIGPAWVAEIILDV